MNNYNFSERQAKAILDLKLNRLVNMEIAKIEQGTFPSLSITIFTLT